MYCSNFEIMTDLNLASNNNMIIVHTSILICMKFPARYCNIGSILIAAVSNGL